jgi:hypothetical protein
MDDSPHHETRRQEAHIMTAPQHRGNVLFIYRDRLSPDRNSECLAARALLRFGRWDGSSTRAHLNPAFEVALSAVNVDTGKDVR